MVGFLFTFEAPAGWFLAEDRDRIRSGVEGEGELGVSEFGLVLRGNRYEILWRGRFRYESLNVSAGV